MNPPAAQEKPESRSHQNHRQYPWLDEFAIKVNLGHNATQLSRLDSDAVCFSPRAFHEQGAASQGGSAATHFGVNQRFWM